MHYIALFQWRVHSLVYPTGIADLKFETTYAIATTDFTVIHELGRVFSNVWPAGLPYYVRWNVKKTKGKGSKATDYTAMLESDISPM